MILNTPTKRLLVLCVTVSLSTSITACGNANKNTSATPRTLAQTTTSASTNPDQEHIQESTPYDADKDTDGAHPDKDDNGKPAPPDKDNDGDSTTKTRYDSDDHSSLYFGHTANATDRRQITALIERYYAAAATEDGEKACSMLYSTYAEAVPEDYGTSPPAPSYERGTTCPAVLTLIFKHFHSEIAARLPKLKISRIGVREHQGLAILSFPSSEREIRVDREGHTWKILALVDNELQ